MRDWPRGTGIGSRRRSRLGSGRSHGRNPFHDLDLNLNLKLCGARRNLGRRRARKSTIVGATHANSKRPKRRPATPKGHEHRGHARAARRGRGRSATSAGPPPAAINPNALANLNPSLGLAAPAASPLLEFFIGTFRTPPFLLPIYLAASERYGVPWQVLAAINEVESDYGRDLSTSSAGAEGWMQFLPAEWYVFGVDANGAGVRDPSNPADAVFAAARYLAAAGAAQNLPGRSTPTTIPRATSNRCSCAPSCSRARRNRSSTGSRRS